MSAAKVARLSIVQDAEPFVNRLLDNESLAHVFEYVGPVGVAALVITGHRAASSSSAELFWRTECMQREEEMELFWREQGIGLQPSLTEAPLLVRESWCLRFSQMHGASCARDSRRARLELALRARGLELRSDSYWCARYVEAGCAGVPGGLAQVVDTMAEMSFYISKTTYCSERDNIQDELHERAWADAEAAQLAGEEDVLDFDTYFEPLGKRELSEFAKDRALRAYVMLDCQANPDCSEPLESILRDVPPSLHDHVRRLLAEASVEARSNEEEAAVRRARLRRIAREARSQAEDSLASHIEAIWCLHQDSASGDILTFPADLSSEGRARLHSYAEELGLVHESHGVGADRCLVVSRPGAPDPLDMD